VGRLRRCGLAITLVIGSVGVFLSGSGQAQAATTPPLLVSAGTVTVAQAFGPSTTFTLSGSIAVGNSVFTGVASGTAAGPSSLGPYALNPIPSFTLSGGWLTGTCSGLWELNPDGLENFGLVNDPIGLRDPVNVASLSCALQLGVAPAAQVSLTLAVVTDNAPTDSHFSGVYGPGLGTVSSPVLTSHGTVDRSTVVDLSPVVQYDLVGDIALGGRVFEGHAQGSYNGATFPRAPFSLTGASPSGDLSAM